MTDDDWLNCTVRDERANDNPDYCLAFYHETGRSEELLDCCWTANYNSTVSPALSSVVTVYPNQTM